MNTSPIDVIVPIYRGLAETQRCIESVLHARQQTPFELIAINDAGPEPALTAWLRELAAAGRLTLLENEANLGFVRTVNRGMSLHADRDVILLNSDTEVANDWLDRLAACAARNPRAGTLTPFSNNATICSYPFEGWTGGVPGTLGLAGLDSLIATTLAGQVVDIPTGVGFCMYIRRTCLDEVGLFDAERFGRGYGEENDFCRRAAARGWRNLLTADVFVFHEGGVSFSEERDALIKNAISLLLEVHPDYLEVVHSFIAQNPIRHLCKVIDQARSAEGGAEEAEVRSEHNGSSAKILADTYQPIQLHISHSWGGGTERWIQDYCHADSVRRNLLLRSISDRNSAGFRLELIEPTKGYAPILAWELALPIRASTISHPEYAKIFSQITDDFDVQSIIISSLIGHSLEVLATNRPTLVILHDVYPFCPAVFACNRTPCSSCTPANLRDCLYDNPLNLFWHNTSSTDWQNLRREYGRLVKRPTVKIIAPSKSVHNQWITLNPELAEIPWTHIPHGIDQSQLPSLPIRPTKSRLRIVIPGRLSEHKGLGLFRQALPGILEHAEILLLGCGTFGLPFKDTPGVEVIENYEISDLSDIIRDFDPDCAMLLSIYHESFSYTLSEMFALGLPVLATELGAFVERIEIGVSGELFPPDPSALTAKIRSLALAPKKLDSMRERVTARHGRSVEDMVRNYNAELPPPSSESDFSRATHRLSSLRKVADERAQARHDIQQLDEKLAQHQELSKHQQLHITQLEKQNLELTKRLDDLHASRSWRLSAPLRIIGRCVRRFVQPTLRLPAAPPPSLATNAGHHPLPILDAAGRREVRERVRHWFGIPDQGRILLSLGTPADSTTAQRYLALIKPVIAARNDLCAIIAGVALDAPCWNDCREDITALVATRQLFLATSLHDRASFLLAADAFLAFDSVSLEQDSTNALEAGLLILCPAGSPTSSWPAATPGRVIDTTSVEAVLRSLKAWLDDIHQE